MARINYEIIDNDADVDVNDPHPDIFDLFVYYRDLYFQGSLDGVSVEWSSNRMTSCGGTCQSVPGGAIIKLSQPLLILRPSKDLKMVLLHEMIHAYCMVNKIRDPDPSGHGPPFQSIMNRINSSTDFDLYRPSGGYNISVYHTMFNEVEYYRQHHWKCERCGSEVHRAMNRKPQEADCRFIRFSKSGGGGSGGAGGSGNSMRVVECTDTRCNWHIHLRHCGGKYIKIKEPEDYDQKTKKKKKQQTRGEDGTSSAPPALFSGQRSITGWLKAVPNSSAAGGNSSGDGGATLPAITAALQGTRDAVEARSLEERRALFEAAALRRVGLQESKSGGVAAYAVGSTNPEESLSIHTAKQQQKEIDDRQHSIEVINLLEDDDEGRRGGGGAPAALPQPPPLPAPSASLPAETTINCPVCGIKFPAHDNAALNSHLDSCLALNA